MNLLADMLLAIGAIGAGVYCMILSRRLRQFTQLESGMGGAIAVLSMQVDEMKKALTAAQQTATASEAALRLTTERAERTALQLQTLMSVPAPAPERRPHLRVVRKRHAGAEPKAEVENV